ncbi:MAG: DUF3656 domain-containing protein [Clostridia bacterium]|nr:DUF3656 domain-containing protein [Clostridia bacterium]
MAELASVFSRDGFTDGYYRRSLSSSMFGVRREEDKEKTREREPFRGLTRRLPVCLSARIQQGIPAVLALSSPDGTLSLTVEGAVPEKAKTAPLTEETVRRQLTKLGGSGLEARSLSLTLEDGLMLPVSALNALRRGGAERYTALLQASVTPDRSPEGLPASTAAKRPVGQRTESKTAVFYDPKAIPAEAFDYFGHIFVPVERYDGSTDGVLLPPVIFDSERPAILAALKQAREQGARHALVGNLGHLDLAREAGLTVHGDFRLNVCNRESAAALEELGVEDGILSPELTLPRMRDVGGATAAIVYGRVPLMVTETCLGKAASGCEACDNGRGVLVDRKGVRFPILRLPPHRNLVLNSVPVYMADRKAELMRAGLTMQHFIFTVESKAQAAQVILAYQQQLPPSFPVCRIR